jgi:hypothetical protein
MIDSMMEAMGFKLVARQRGNVIEPVFEIQCKVCGETHPSDNIPFNCETGDGE